MNYLAYFAVIIPLELLIIVGTLYVIRRRTLGADAGTLLHLTWQVLALTVVANVVALIPWVGLGTIIISFIALKKLSRLNVLPTMMLAFSLGIVCLVLATVVGRYLQVPLIGQPTGGLPVSF